jgi:hypothetical protein
MHHHDRPVQRPPHGDRDKPAEESGGRRRGIEGQLEDEARDAERMRTVDASEDRFLQLATELIGHAARAPRTWPRVFLGE